VIELLGFQPVLFLDSQCFGPGAALPAHLQDRQRGFRRLVWVGSESSGVEAGRVSERKRISFLVHSPDNACKGLHSIDVRHLAATAEIIFGSAVGRRAFAQKLPLRFAEALRTPVAFEAMPKTFNAPMMRPLVSLVPGHFWVEPRLCPF
jgi:hypothetical protein